MGLPCLISFPDLFKAIYHSLLPNKDKQFAIQCAYIYWMYGVWVCHGCVMGVASVCVGVALCSLSVSWVGVGVVGAHAGCGCRGCTCRVWVSWVCVSPCECL